MGVPGGGKVTFMSGMAGERKGLSSTTFMGAPGVVAGERKGLLSNVLVATPGVVTDTKDVALEGGGGKVIFARGFACEWKGLSSIIVLDAPDVVDDTKDGEFLLVGVAELW